MARDRLTVVSVAREKVNGNTLGLHSGYAGYANYLVTRSNTTPLPILRGARFTPNVENIERALARSSLTPAADAAGAESGTLTFEMSIQGNAAGSATTAPPFAEPLLNCGFEMLAVKRVPIGTVTNGPVYSWSTYEQATSGADGRIVVYVEDGDAYAILLPYVNSAALNNSGLLTIDGGSTTIVVSGDATDAITFAPSSSIISQAQVESIGTAVMTTGLVIYQDISGVGTARGRIAIRNTIPQTDFPVMVRFEHNDLTPPFDDSVNWEVDGFASANPTLTSGQIPAMVGAPSGYYVVNMDGVETGIQGARGNCRFRIPALGIGELSFEMTGKLLATTDAKPIGSPTDGATPPPVKGGTYLFGSATVPKFNEMTVDLGNNIAMRECPGESTGYLAAEIVERAIKLTTNHEMNPAAEEIQALKTLKSKALFRTIIEWGAAAGTGNRFRVDCFQAQIESATPGERAGRVIVDATLKATGINEDEFFLTVF